VLAKFLQHGLTQKVGIEFAVFSKLNNFFGDSFVDWIALVAKLKGCVSHFVCHAHDPIGLVIEFGVVEKLREGHDLPSLSAGGGTLCPLRVNRVTDSERIHSQQKSERAGPHATSGRRALQRLTQCRVSSW